MTAWLLIGLAWACLFGFWLWLGALFDWISEQHFNAQPTAEEVGKLTREKDSSSL